MGVAQHIRDGAGNIIVGQNTRPDSVIDIMVDIGDPVRVANDLALQGLRDIGTCVANDTHAHFICQV